MANIKQPKKVAYKTSFRSPALITKGGATTTYNPKYRFAKAPVGFKK
jgi:hypothetical protein